MKQEIKIKIYDIKTQKTKIIVDKTNISDHNKIFIMYDAFVEINDNLIGKKNTMDLTNLKKLLKNDIDNTLKVILVKYCDGLPNYYQVLNYNSTTNQLVNSRHSIRACMHGKNNKRTNSYSTKKIRLRITKSPVSQSNFNSIVKFNNKEGSKLTKNDLVKQIYTGNLAFNNYTVIFNRDETVTINMTKESKTELEIIADEV
jgi:hypothetical protein